MFQLRLTEDQEEIALKAYKEAIVFDGLLTWGNLDHLDAAEQILKGGITVGNFTVAHWPHNFTKGVANVIRYRKTVSENPHLFKLVECIEDIEKAKALGKLGVILGFQDAKPIEDDLDNLEVYYALGVRIIQLTYNAQNYVGSGCCELSYGKLTYFGRKVVRRMNELGIAIDLSHCADETTMDAIETSEKPVLITHSSTRALCNAYGRNKADDQIRALASKGGAIGICLSPSFTKRNPETLEVLPSTVEDVVDHMEHVINLVGIDHVGWGSDLCVKWIEKKQTPPTSSLRHWRPLRPDVFGKGPTEYYDPRPEGLGTHLEMINIARCLARRGYGKEDIKKVLGGNFVRVLKEIWQR
ncbi:MAG TPA: membrane dipeptidase [Corynebacteriales bacterium]|nr:membrane dipeptidase [Mycobacteriales bacterium]